MPLTKVDKELLHRCVNKQPGAWNDFVDRFLGLIYHTIHHTAHLRSATLRPEDVEDVAAEVLLQIVAKDFLVLRQFKGQSSLTTYLVVIARRICIHELTRRTAASEVQPAKTRDVSEVDVEQPPRAEVGLESLEEVQRLLSSLGSKERRIVAMYYLEGRSYEEISSELDIPVNSIGPILSRARKRLRGGAEPPKKPARRRQQAQPDD